MERKKPFIPDQVERCGTRLSRRRLVLLTAASTIGGAVRQAPTFATQAIATASPVSAEVPTIQAWPDTPAMDEAFSLLVMGLTPGEHVSVASRSRYGYQVLGAEAQYEVDESGSIDFARNRPLSGNFEVADPMAFIWAATETSRIVQKDESDSALVIVVYRGEDEIARLAMERAFLPEGYRPDYIYTEDRIGYVYPRVYGIDAPAPAVIVLGGSEGGITNFDLTPALLAMHGYVVLHLAYFRAGSLPQTLERIPLEYFGEAIAWLQEQPSVQSDKIGVLGYSRGGELALLLGSHYPELTSVVSVSGSGVVNRGLGANYSETTASAWSWKGEDIPYADLSSGELVPPDNSIIPVEQINGPVLLVSGDGDELWPSTELSRFAWQRLKHADRLFLDQFLSYPGAGHFIWPPYVPMIFTLGEPSLGNNAGDTSYGGTPDRNQQASVNSWRAILQHFATSLHTDEK